MSEHRFEKITDIKALCRLGVPANRRPAAWLAISRAAEHRRQAPLLYDSVMKGKDLPHSASTMMAFSQIEKDLDRTFPNHPYFRSQFGIDSLRKVLTAFVLCRPRVNYCQCMYFAF